MKAGIAGAGIMGRLLAFNLVNAGWQVTLFDQDDKTGAHSCSMAAAGLLTPITELEKSDLLSAEFGGEALNHHWDSIIQSLPQPIYFAKKGTLVLAHPQERAELTRFTRLLDAKLAGRRTYQKLSQIYIVGASEIESERQTPITVRTVLELLSSAYSLHSGFAEAQVINTMQHCRPALPDLQPSIQYSRGFIAINGLYRHGFSLAPVLANEVMRWLQSGISGVSYPQIWSDYDECLFKR